MKFISFLICLWLINIAVFAQQTYTISGTISDAQSGEVLIGANIASSDYKYIASTNHYGFYSLSLPALDSLMFSISYVGYEKQKIALLLTADTTIYIALKPSNLLGEIVIDADKNGDKIAQRNQISSINIPIQQIKDLPSLGGEGDVLKSLQMLPGIQFGQEGSSNIYVRGGSPDQNLLLLDEVPVYNVNHLFGFFSVFMPEAVKSVEAIKGGFPARYGGRLSSVIDIRTKEGNMKKWVGTGTIGLLASNFSVEGPIKKDRSSLFLAARRTYADLLARPLIKSQFKKEGVDGMAGYWFYDINAKFKHLIDDKNSLYASFYAGTDKAFTHAKTEFQIDDATSVLQNNESALQWGNLTASLRYNHLFHAKLFANFTAAYTRYHFATNSYFEQKEKKYPDNYYTAQYGYSSAIADALAKANFEWFPTPQHTLRFGVWQSFKFYQPGATLNATSSNDFKIDTSYNSRPFGTLETALFGEDNISVGKKWQFNIGLRYELFHAQQYTTHYLQPRVSICYLLTPNLSFKAAYAQVSQNLHLLTNSTIGLPTDMWVPATAQIRPETSEQIGGGIFADAGKWNISIEGFYKTMNNLIEYKEGASFLNTFDGWENKVAVGKGNAYGMEFFAHKKEGKWNGWFAYTLSWTNRLFPELNKGQTFPFRYDRRHYANIFFSHQLRKPNRHIAIAWIYATGSAVTLPLDKYNVPNNEFHGHFEVLLNGNYFNYGQAVHAESRNNYRMRDYHRFDITYSSSKKKKHGERTWTIGVYNVYGRRNPFYLYVKSDYDYVPIYDAAGNIVDFEYRVVKNTLKEFSYFSFIPAISYQMRFE